MDAQNRSLKIRILEGKFYFWEMLDFFPPVLVTQSCRAKPCFFLLPLLIKGWIILLGF